MKFSNKDPKISLKGNGKEIENEEKPASNKEELINQYFSQEDTKEISQRSKPNNLSIVNFLNYFRLRRYKRETSSIPI